MSNATIRSQNQLQNKVHLFYNRIKMTKETAIKLFEQKHLRSVWDAEQEKWYFSIIDVLEVLIENNRPRKY